MLPPGTSHRQLVSIVDQLMQRPSGSGPQGPRGYPGVDGVDGAPGVPGVSYSIRAKIIAGGAAGAHAVTGLLEGDTIILVAYLAGAGMSITDISNLTSEFVVTAGTITNLGGTVTTGGKLVVLWTTP